MALQRHVEPLLLPLRGSNCIAAPSIGQLLREIAPVVVCHRRIVFKIREYLRGNANLSHGGRTAVPRSVRALRAAVRGRTSRVRFEPRGDLLEQLAYHRAYRGVDWSRLGGGLTDICMVGLDGDRVASHDPGIGGNLVDNVHTDGL